MSPENWLQILRLQANSATAGGALIMRWNLPSQTAASLPTPSLNWHRNTPDRAPDDQE